MRASTLKSIVILVAFVGRVEILPWALAQNQEASINDLKRTPGKYVDQKIVVKGRLQFVGRNYFTDPHFVIVDEVGNQVPVTIWVPLEVPPPMPGKEESFKDRPKVMRDYLGQKLSVTGIFRVDPVKGEHTIEVESVVEDEEQ